MVSVEHIEKHDVWIKISEQFYYNAYWNRQKVKNISLH